MESIVILLTGTIKVSNTPNLKLTNTSRREEEYFNSIKKWLSLKYPIIFCENSNYRSEKINSLIKDLPDEKFEYLKFSTAKSYLGKGNGEAEIIDFVFKNSRLINQGSIICKATGKNYVRNASDLIKKMQAPPFSNNTVSAILKRNLTFADSRFFFFENRFYHNHLLKYIYEIDEQNENYFEHVLAKSIHSALANGESWSMLPGLPMFEGYYGSDGTKYKNGILKKWLKTSWYFIVTKAFLSKR